jgi:nucleotidyltransferase/DNA polymerase involved in DNA repair
MNLLLSNKTAIEFCSDILKYSKQALETKFGKKTGEKLWFYAHGIDNRPLQTHKVALFSHKMRSTF